MNKALDLFNSINIQDKAGDTTIKNEKQNKKLDALDLFSEVSKEEIIESKYTTDSRNVNLDTITFDIKSNKNNLNSDINKSSTTTATSKLSSDKTTTTATATALPKREKSDTTKEKATQQKVSETSLKSNSLLSQLNNIKVPDMKEGGFKSNKQLDISSIMSKDMLNKAIKEVDLLEEPIKTVKEDIKSSDVKDIYKNGKASSDLNDTESKLVPSDFKDDFIKYYKDELIKTKNFLSVAGTTIISYIKMKAIYKKFIEHPTITDTGDFYMLYYNKMLMAYRYKGSAKEIEIPAYVEKIPVVYVDKGIFTAGLGIIDNYRIRGLKSSASIDNLITPGSNGRIGENLFTGITSVKLPNTLVYLPDYIFTGCKNLKKLFLPSSITFISPFAFNGSKLEEIYFNGDAPDKYKNIRFGKKVKVYCKKQFINNYR